jgi:hypothetical protein
MTLQPLAAGDLGTDVNTAFGVPLRWGLATGRKNLGNAIARRLSTARGSLHYDLPYGYDLRGSLNAGFTKAQIAQMQSAITAEVEKDERVQGCNTTVAYTFATSSLKMTLVLDTATGPFQLILLVTSASVDIFNGNQPTAAAATAAATSTVTVISVTAPGASGTPGTTGPGAPGVGGSMELPFNWLKRSSSGAEELLDEQTANFNDLAGGALTANLSGSGLSAAGVATARLYWGGTLGSLDGTLIGSVTFSNGVMGTFTPLQVPFNNPTGTRLVKITLQSSGAGTQAQLLNPMAQFSAP